MTTCDCIRRLTAGTLWGPYWCPEHDRQRLDRIDAQLEALLGGEQR